MLNWVVKVVPQPRDGPGSLGEDLPHAQPAGTKSSKDDAKKAGKVKVLRNHDEEQTSEESTGQGGMLNWLSNGFAHTLPQPTSSPRLSRNNSDARSVNGEEVESNGVIGWISQGLGKVVPQPDEKYKRDNRYDPDDVTEVYLVSELPDAEPLPHIPVVEVLSEDEEEDSVPRFPPKMVDWLKNAMPHRVLASGPGSTEGPQSHRSSLDKLLSPPPESLSGAEDDSKSSKVVGWFVQGLGLKMPQPVLKTRDDATMAAEVLQTVPSQLKTSDLVVEEVDSDWEGQDQEVPSKVVASPPRSPKPEPEPVQTAQPVQPEMMEQAVQTQVQTEVQVQTETQTLCIPEATQTPQEDAETQTDRWTPMIENIRREAEGVVMANMEERLMQERVEMVRMAEEVARHTAEMAIRQMAEAQSIRLSLQSQELPEDNAEDPELHMLKEEESDTESTITM